MDGAEAGDRIERGDPGELHLDLNSPRHEFATTKPTDSIEHHPDDAAMETNRHLQLDFDLGVHHRLEHGDVHYHIEKYKKEIYRDWVEFGLSRRQGSEDFRGSHSSALNDLADAYKRKGDIDLEIYGWKELFLLILNHYQYSSRLLNVEREQKLMAFSDLLADAYSRKADINVEVNGWIQLLSNQDVKSSELLKAVSNRLAEALERQADCEVEIRGWTIILMRCVESKEWESWMESFVRRLAGAYERKGDIKVEILGWTDLVIHSLKEGVLDKLFVEHLSHVYRKDPNVDTEIDGWINIILKSIENLQHRNSFRYITRSLRNAYKRKCDNGGEIHGWMKILSQSVKHNKLEALNNDLCEFLADVYERNDDVDSEIHGWSHLLKNNPTNKALSDRLAHVYKRKDNIDMEIKGWCQFIEQNPSNPILSRRLADAFMRGGQVVQEIAIRENQVQMDPSENSILELAEAYKRTGDIDFEIEAIKNFLNKQDTAKQWVLQLTEQLGDAYDRKRDMNGAISTMSECLLRFPLAVSKQAMEQNLFRRSFLDHYADILKRKGDTEDEIRRWKDLMEQYPKEWPFFDKLSDAYERRSDIDLDITDWMNIAEQNPTVWWIIDKLLDAYQRKGDLEVEIAGWKKLLSSDRWKLLGTSQSRLGANENLVRATELKCRIDDELDKEFESRDDYLSVLDEAQFVTSKLSVKLPNNSDGGLFMALYESSEEFLEAIKVLPRVLYGIGLDILPDNLLFIDNSHKEYFSGILNVIGY